MKTVLITGASSGLGKAIAEVLPAWLDCDIITTSLEAGFDLTQEQDIKRFCRTDLLGKNIDFLINCAGINYINWHEDTPTENWDYLMDLNARSLFILTKELILQGNFANPSTIVNIISNASHIPMTNSIAYNASKGAAHIMTLQMARELRKRHGITVFGISPNKMHSTAMSDYIADRVCELRGMTKEEAQAYQLASLPAGKETDPAACAEFISFLLSERWRHEYLHGTVIPYGA